MQFDVGGAVVGPGVRVNWVRPAKAEPFGAEGYVVGKDPRHSLVRAAVVDADEISCRLGSLEEAQPMVPVAQTGVVVPVVQRPVQYVVFVKVAAGVHRHLAGVENKVQVGADGVGRARRERRVEPEFVVEIVTGGVLDARSDRQVAPAGRQVQRDGGADAVGGGRIPQRDGDARRGGDDLVSPRLAPLVAVLLHRQPPLNAADRQPPVLLFVQRPPVSGFDHGVLIEFVVTSGLENHLIDPPAQFRQQRHPQVVVLQH